MLRPRIAELADGKTESMLKLGGEVMDKGRELQTYVQTARNEVRAMLKRRGAEVSGRKGNPVEDGFFKSLEAILQQFRTVESMAMAFMVQTHSLETAPTQEAAAEAFQELCVAVEALFALELEARAIQARMSMSSTLTFYAGQDSRTEEISFVVGKDLSARFKSLATRVRQERTKLFGRSGRVDPGDLLSILVAVGEVNVPLLALLGAPKWPLHVPAAKVSQCTP